MFNSLNSLLRVSMEAAAPAALANTVPETDLIAESDQAQLNLCDAKEAVVVSHRDMERLFEAVDSLEAIAQSMEAYTATGMNQSTAFIAQLAIDQAVAPTGVCYKGVSLEGFVGHRAGHSTRLAMEDLHETGKAVMEKLIEAYRQFRAALVRFFQQLQLHVKLSKQQIQKFLAELQSAGEEKRQEAVNARIENGKLFRRLAIDDEVPHSLAQLADDNLKLAQQYLSTTGYGKDALEFADEISNFAARAAQRQGEFEQIVTEAFKLRCPMPAGLTEYNSSNGIKHYRSPLLPGNHRIEFTQGEASDMGGEEGARAHLGALYRTGLQFTAGHQSMEKGYLPRATRADQIGICAANLKALEFVEGFLQAHGGHEIKHSALINSALINHSAVDTADGKGKYTLFRHAIDRDIETHRAVMGICNHIADVSRALQSYALQSYGERSAQSA
jgi:hypothetical protein